MFKLFSVVAAFAVSAIGFVACNNDANVPAPTPVNFSNEKSTGSLESIEEVADDSEPGARIAAADISKENKVYQVFQVTGTYSTTATSTGASLAYTTGSTNSATVADSVVKAKNGWAMFSVKTEKYNTLLKKTVDKTLSQTYYMKDKDAKVWKKMVTVSASGATFTFLPNYFKNGLTFSTSGGTSATLN
jgi:hypothetical protein